jgi:alpha-galactosidase
VALFNRGTSAAQITTSAGAIGLPAARRYHLFNLWTDQTTTTKSTITASVPANAVVLYQVTAG